MKTLITLTAWLALTLWLGAAEKAPSVPIVKAARQQIGVMTNYVRTYGAGDIVAWDLGGGITHIGIVSDRKSGNTPLIIHNIGRGAQEEDILFKYKVIGHYQLNLLPTWTGSQRIASEAEAIAVVVAEIERTGGDPHREECSASLREGRWYVVSWHIYYPKNAGDSRFVPGGYTTYVVTEEGNIDKTVPGL